MEAGDNVYLSANVAYFMFVKDLEHNLTAIIISGYVISPETQD